MSFIDLTDDDVRRSLRRALWLTGALTLVATPILWVGLGWRSWVLFLVGAAISGTGIYEWLQLMAAMIARMDVGTEGVQPKPLGPVLAWFFLRMGLAVVLLYVSLKSLDGSIYALLGGLALSLIALLVEAIRLLSRRGSGPS
ncbi:MAG TPA: hypothetical protein VHX63_00580 [Acidobacteriaceae bacterium]|nr:hypothetical protein [Acidobacteriaceae bacterium]